MGFSVCLKPLEYRNNKLKALKAEACEIYSASQMCIRDRYFPVQSTFELLENSQVIIYLFAFSIGKPYHCDPWSVAFLTPGTYI